MSDREREWLAARGVLAGGVAAGLAEPLGRVKEILAAAVDQLDRHIASSKGPEPLPWHKVSRVREDLMDAYLDVGRAARLAGDLAAVIGVGRGVEEVDVNDVVERAVALARHGLGAARELLLDLGTLPPARVDAARLAQVLAHVLLAAAQDAEPGTAIAVRTGFAEARLRVVVAHTPTAAASAAETAFAELVREAVAADGGELSHLRRGAELAVEIALPRA